MKKYIGIEELTEEYLSGKLQKVTMEYTSPVVLKVSILYEDQYYYLYDYDVEFDSKTHESNFLCHKSANQRIKVNLNRDLGFEKAVQNYIYTTSK